MIREIHPIEVESYRRMRARLDTSHFPPLTRAVVERVVHSAADLEYADDLVMDEGDLAKAHAALHAGAPVVVDVEMVAAGITRRETVCRLKDARSGPGLTRSAHAIRLAILQVLLTTGDKHDARRHGCIDYCLHGKASSKAAATRPEAA